MCQPVSQRSLDVAATIATFLGFVNGPTWDKLSGKDAGV